ncbi:MAG: hypothetical protein AVDCRST_MAG51-1370, partial [uncultured Ramlibacter sp.]
VPFRFSQFPAPRAVGRLGVVPGERRLAVACDRSFGRLAATAPGAAARNRRVPGGLRPAGRMDRDAQRVAAPAGAGDSGRQPRLGCCLHAAVGGRPVGPAQRVGRRLGAGAGRDGAGAGAPAVAGLAQLARQQPERIACL